MHRGLLTFLPHRHVVATLPALFDDIDFSGLLEVIEHLLQVVLLFLVPFSDSVEADKGDVKGDSKGMGTLPIRCISISSAQCFLLFFGSGSGGDSEKIPFTCQGLIG